MFKNIIIFLTFLNWPCYLEKADWPKKKLLGETFEIFSEKE